MSTVDRKSFNATFSGGIDTKNASLQQKLAEAGVSAADVARADLNGDGVISGAAELNAAFRLADSFDKNGSSESFNKAGKSGQVYDAFVAGALPPKGKFADAIVKAAADRAARFGEGYAKENVPVSPNPRLEGNKKPDATKLGWLKGFWKCNQFVGDTLTQAGVKTPTYTMASGGLHYMEAEKWPKQTQLFDRITDPAKLQIGDLVVRDYPGSGDATAHIEIVTGLNPMKTTGAHEDGAYESQSDWLAGGTYNPAEKAFEVDGNMVYLLRPKVAK
ncbi:MAG: hypothetical protein ACJ790_00575 [Myxococcaceae bacterium]